MATERSRSSASWARYAATRGAEAGRDRVPRAQDSKLFHAELYMARVLSETLESRVVIQGDRKLGSRALDTVSIIA